MKCPQCSYHSFEFLDICKKCQADLSAHKSKYRIIGFIPAAISRKFEAKPRVNLIDDEETIAQGREVGISGGQTAQHSFSTATGSEPDRHQPVNDASLLEQFGVSSMPVFFDDKVDIEQPFSIDSEILPPEMGLTKSPTEKGEEH